MVHINYTTIYSFSTWYPLQMRHLLCHDMKFYAPCW